MSTEQSLQMEGIIIKLRRKKIKRLHLIVQPPFGEVRVSAPLRLSLKEIVKFVQTHLPWVTEQQQKIQEQYKSQDLQYKEAEEHYFLGKLYLLKISEYPAAPLVELQDNYLHLRIHPTATIEKKAIAMEKFYRAELKKAIATLIAKWEAIINVRVSSFSLQSMKTRWGVCTPDKKHIKFNTELAKKPIECLEYIVVHEIVHFLEASHNQRFKALMDSFMPEWQLHQKILNCY